LNKLNFKINTIVILIAFLPFTKDFIAAHFLWLRQICLET